MTLSIIIPAFNEEKELPRCLQSVDAAVASVQQDVGSEPTFDVEVIVADNNSTDATAEVAKAAGASVVFEKLNQISRARNAGANIATGDWFLFIDADSQLHADTLRELLKVIETGLYVGGGSVVRIDHASLGVRLTEWLWNTFAPILKWAAGSFVFCRADVFRDLGGFSLDLYASEEIDFSRRLKKYAKTLDLKTIILKSHPHVSSGRKMELYSPTELAKHLFRCLWSPRKTLRDRSRLDFFYDGRR